jgi:hypothetical protein
VKGDVNHDCVLTLDEFGAIIRRRKPQFSDRRILRMFREALMGSADQSFALSMEAFVVVCNDHGLVSLLPDDRMVDPFATPASVPAISRRQSRMPVSKISKQDVQAPSQGTTALQEIPEDIVLDESALPSARAQEVDEDEKMGWEQPESDSEVLY